MKKTRHLRTKFILDARERNTTIDITHDVETNEISIHGDKVSSVRSVLSYPREGKNDKIVVSHPCVASSLRNIDDDIMKRHGYILAIDTNKQYISNKHICVTTACRLANTNIVTKKTEIHLLRSFVFALENTNISQEPIGIFIFLNNAHFLDQDPVTLISDYDLANHDNYNSKLKPYYKDHFIPHNLTITYASSDTKNDSIANKMIAECDKYSNYVFDDIKKRNIDLTYSGVGDENFYFIKQVIDNNMRL